MWNDIIYTGWDVYHIMCIIRCVCAYFSFLIFSIRCVLCELWGWVYARIFMEIGEILCSIFSSANYWFNKNSFSFWLHACYTVIDDWSNKFCFYSDFFFRNIFRFIDQSVNIYGIFFLEHTFQTSRYEKRHSWNVWLSCYIDEILNIIGLGTIAKIIFFYLEKCMISGSPLYIITLLCLL